MPQKQLTDNQGHNKRGPDPIDPQPHPAHPTHDHNPHPQAQRPANRHHTSNHRPQPLRPSRRHPHPRSQRQRQPRRDPRNNGPNRTPSPRVAVELGERRHLPQNHKNKSKHPERPDIRLLHDPQRILGGFPTTKPIRSIRKPIQMQPPSKHGRHGHAPHGG